MPEIEQRTARRTGLAVAATAAALVVGAIVILWSWNTVAVELFAAPAFSFRHAIAIEGGVAVVATLIAFAARVIAGGRHRRAAT